MKKLSRAVLFGPALVVSAVVLAACAELAMSDDETCALRGFEKGTREYGYCRDKLQQFRAEEDARSQRFLDMMSE